MHPVQERTNTLGIDYSKQRLTEYIYIWIWKEQFSNPECYNQSRTTLIDSTTANTTTEKIREFAGAGIEPSTFCTTVFNLLSQNNSTNWQIIGLEGGLVWALLSLILGTLEPPIIDEKLKDVDNLLQKNWHFSYSLWFVQALGLILG